VGIVENDDIQYKTNRYSTDVPAASWESDRHSSDNIKNYL